MTGSSASLASLGSARITHSSHATTGREDVLQRYCRPHLVDPQPGHVSVGPGVDVLHLVLPGHVQQEGLALARHEAGLCLGVLLVPVLTCPPHPLYARLGVEEHRVGLQPVTRDNYLKNIGLNISGYQICWSGQSFIMMNSTLSVFISKYPTWSQETTAQGAADQLSDVFIAATSRYKYPD